MKRTDLVRRTPLKRSPIRRSSVRIVRSGRIIYRPDPTDAELDKLCGDYVKARDKYTCQWPTCGKRYAPGSRGLQWCHFISRRYRKTRWNPLASVTLCTAHHFAMDGDPHKKIAFATSRVGQAAYDRLRMLSQAVGKVDRQAVRLELRSLLNSIDTFAS